jgi:hypothetical protein
MLNNRRPSKSLRFAHNGRLARAEYPECQWTADP